MEIKRWISSQEWCLFFKRARNNNNNNRMFDFTNKLYYYGFIARVSCSVLKSTVSYLDNEHE